MSKIKQMSFFDSIHELYQNELYDEIAFLDELVPAKFRGFLNPKHEGLLGAYIGEAYYQLEKYNLAFQNYRDALEVYTHCPRAILIKNFTEADIRYRFHRVLVKLRRFDEAIRECSVELILLDSETLKVIPENESPPKVKAALVKLLLARDGTSVNPTCYYESIMKASSSALHATSHLLKNGIIGLEAIPTPTVLKNIPQVHTFLESQSLLARKQSREAVDLLLNLSDCSFRMLIEAGYHLYNVGNDEAKHVLLRAHRLEPERVTLMDTLSYLLFLEPVYHPELECLAIGLMKEDPNSAEAQISFGYLTRTLGKSYRSKALQMAFSACQINQHSNRPKTQALLLKTGILVDMDKGEEASKTISEAIKFEPHNFDFQRALVNSYLSKSKIREARTWLSNITIARPNEPRVQILRAQVLLKSGTQVGRNEAQKLLEQAVQDDPHQMEGVWTLADVYEKSGKFDVAVDFLKRLSQGSYSSANLGRMHQILGELLTKSQEPGLAYIHVNRALSNGIDEALSQIPNLEGVIYQTPSPLAPVARQPQAPRRQRPSRQNSDMDSSIEFNNSNDQGGSQ